VPPRSRYVPASLDRRVRERANHCCEYCGLAQAGQEATFHIDHVVPRAAGGPTEYENLALACVSCSLRKAARTEAHDPETDQTVSLYSPRDAAWNDHFDEAAEFHQRGTRCTKGCIDEAHLNLGLIRRAQERFAEAAQCFEKALELDPDYAPAKVALEDVRSVLDDMN
jgi:tetratricopeptide (TPR) repeat protein